MIVCVLWISLSLISQPIRTQNNPMRFADILPQLEEILKGWK
jgi:hypothetical protein